MAAARANEVEYLPDGGVRLAGVELAADEVEILATPRPGTAVAHDNGLVVVIDTELDDELRAEGDARELIARRAGPAQAGGAGARRHDRAVARRASRRARPLSSPTSPDSRRTRWPVRAS